ncbi:MAG: GAF domain-containing protein, partial [Planctomycetota bacterium]
MTAERLLDERYEIVRTLGAGAAGQLFEVRDLQREGDIAALKVLRPRERDPGLVPLFREEFLLLAGIDHPSVVRARDFGVLSSGEPYFTMDFVPGENARVLVAEDRLEPVDYIDLCSSVLGALARVHAQGILHRDLKPENIIVRRSGERLAPVLVDFGLAGDMVEGSTAVSGTPPYIAPEVIAGAAPDARADLFGFGMALYEICTGRRPGEAKQLLRDATRLLAPDKLRTSLDRQARDSVPKKFEDFLVRLLAANPAARYPTAGAALDALASIYEADIEVPTEGLRAAVHSVQAPLVGRDAAQKAMLDRIDALREGKLLEPLVVVAGRAGYGVTRLLQSVRHQASAAGCEVFAGRTLAELGRAVAARHEGMRVEGAAPHEIIFQLDAALQDPSVRELPVLLLDDVHQMSDAAVQSVREWVASMESRRGRVRALVVLGGCSEGGSAGAELLASAGRAVPLELRDLAPLTETDLRRALSILLGGAAVPMPLVETLHRATDGAPRAFAELLDLLVESGALDVAADPPRLDEEKLRATTLPQSVIEIARARAEDASDAAREALGRMALLPVPAPLRVARVLAGPALDELLDRGLLVRQGALIEFPYDLARRAHDLWDAEDRRATAHALADALGEEDAPYRAYLWIAAGDRVRAVEIGREAADAMMREGRTDEARALLREICGDEPDEATATAYLRALVATGAVEEATRFGTRLLEKQRSSAILFATANALSRLRRLDEALRLFERHEPWLEGVSRVRLHQGRAVVHLQQQNFTAAYESSLAAERLAGGIHGMGGAVASVRARIFRERCWLQRAKQLYDIALEGDLTGVTREITRLNRAGLLLTLGRIVPALRGMRGVKPARGGLTYAMMQMALSDAFGHVGRYARALRHVEVGREIQRAAARAKFVAWCLQHEAKLLLLLGRPAEGEARLLRARSLPGVQDDAEAQEEVRIAQSAFLMYAGQMTAARELVEGDGEAGEAEAMRRAMARARIAQLEGEDAGETLAAWREVVSWASLRRDRLVMAHARVGLAEAYAQQGAWRFAEQLVERGRGDLFACRTPVRARALMLRAAAALQRNEPGTAGRLLEESIAIANRCDDAPLRAELYATAASILEEPVMQRFLREPTAAASAALLEVAREIWAVYGNETMLRKIDLHLSELPRPATEAGGGPEADRLVKILHIAREMNRELDRDSLLGLILDRAIELTGAERGFVILLEGGREEIRLARNLDRESVSEPEQKISSQIIREVIDTGRIVRSEDAEFDSHFEESLSVRQLRLKSVIAVPFRSAARTIGALYLDNRFRTANFTEREERLLELFADQAVVAIDRAALVRELEAKSQELKDAVRLREREVKNKAKQ